MTESAPPAASGFPPARLTTLAIVALVLLRLATGWHFWCEGTKKLAYDSDGNLYVDFSAEGFFQQAVGPLADFYRSKLPSAHQWEALLAVPREQTVESAQEIGDWAADYEVRQLRASRENKVESPDVPEFAPYAAWAEQIRADLRQVHEQFVKLPGVTEEQQAQAAARLEFRERQLAEYLAAEAGAIATWQHELWRLQQLENSGEAGDVPFTDERIAEKKAETTAAGRAWVEQVRTIERGYAADLAAIAAESDEKARPPLLASVTDITTDEKTRQLAQMNIAVTCLIIGVGICLLTGLLTRLAALGGMAFLLAVMSTQPPWVPEANLMFFYYQLVEFMALGVLFAAAAGRYAGLDFFLYAIWRKVRAS